jgi:tRNA pseudouridine13 synthase
MDAISQISRILRVKPQNLNYAGTKDRRAATVQRCSVRYQRAENLVRANNTLHNVVTGDFEYRNEPIHLGQLAGNEFVITLKDCAAGDSDDVPVEERLEKVQSLAASALESMSRYGWINYFGHQRFGSHAIGTHEVGKKILVGNFRDAVNSVLAYDTEIASKSPSEALEDCGISRDEYYRAVACRSYADGGDPQSLAKTMPRRFSGELSVLNHLGKSDTSARDFTGAIMCITRGLRSMYLHAYQSYVWNHVASRRWAQHGAEVVQGDLILDTRSTQDENDEDGLRTHGSAEDDDNTRTARPLTQEEAASGNFTIFDVVLPSPGYNVVYPNNDIGAFYVEFMGRPENGSLDPHNMRRIQREFSMPGHYRPLMTKFLAEPSLSVRTYTDDNEQMHPTDLDLLKANGAIPLRSKRPHDDQNHTPANIPQKRAKIDGEAAVEKEIATGDTPGNNLPIAQAEDTANMDNKSSTGNTLDTEDKVTETKIAVVAKFQLVKSAYATIALRELMGVPSADV